jgi:hypothetical protein
VLDGISREFRAVGSPVSMEVEPFKWLYASRTARLVVLEADRGIKLSGQG